MIATACIGIIALYFTFLYDREVIDWGFSFAMLLLIIFCAIRWEWGNDMVVYENNFDSFGIEGVNFWDVNKFSLLDTRSDRTIEIGWTFLNLLCQPIGFFGMVILLSFIEGGIIYWFIKSYVERGYTTFAVFLYVYNSDFLVLGCSMMRQWLAMCIILVAVHFLIKGKSFLFSLLVLLAASFHSAALICFIIYFLKALRNIRFQGINIRLFFLIVFVWTFAIGPIIAYFVNVLFGLPLLEQYSVYALSSESGSSVGIATSLNILVVLICLFSLNDASDNNKIITWVYAGSLFFFPIAAIIPLSGRLLFFFNIFMLAALPNGLINLEDKFLIKILLICWVLFWTIYTFVTFFNSPTWIDAFMEYKTIFSAPDWR